MQKDFEEYNKFCIEHKLKACKPESLQIFLNIKNEMPATQKRG